VFLADREGFGFQQIGDRAVPTRRARTACGARTQGFVAMAPRAHGQFVTVTVLVGPITVRQHVPLDFMDNCYYPLTTYGAEHLGEGRNTLPAR
jgi:hypothetical protein